MNPGIRGTALSGKDIRRLLMQALGAIALLALLPLFPAAQSIPPDQVRVSTPAYSPSSAFAPLLGLYTYAVTWNGIPAATLELKMARHGDEYELNAKAWTSRAIDYLYRLRYQSETVISAKTLAPKRSVSITRANAREKRMEMTFLPDGVIHSQEKDKRGKEKSFRFDPANFTLDPYSAGLLALSLDWKVGDRRLFDAFNGKNRYLITLTALEEAVVTIGGVSRQAMVIRPAVQKLTETEPDGKKLREARIFVSTGPSREILKIVSEVFVGSVNTTLVSFTPADGS